MFGITEIVWFEWGDDESQVHKIATNSFKLLRWLCMIVNKVWASTIIV